MKLNLILFPMLLFFAMCASADPVGTWKISMEGPMGTMVNHLTIRKEGDAHFASMATPQGEAEIGELEVDGDHFEFAFSRTMGARTMTMSYACDVEGDTLTGTTTTPRGKLPFTGTRQ
jgi:hypothetical protein